MSHNGTVMYHLNTVVLNSYIIGKAVPLHIMEVLGGEEA
jgi:hypothetical protein